MSKLTIQHKLLKGKILYIDCETSLIHILAHCIGSKQNIGHHQIIADKKISVICYMVEGEKKVHALTWDESRDDTKMLTDFVEVVKQYPIVVAQNGDNFDVKVIRGRCWLASATPLPDLTTLDTLKMSRQNFKLTSHRLDYMSKAVGSSGKIGTDFQLWVDVENGDKRALAQMVKYCKKDVLELREVFLSMLPYCVKLPHNLGKLFGKTPPYGAIQCGQCGSVDVRKDGFAHKGQGKFQRYSCNQCGFYGRDNKNLINKVS